MSLTTLNRIVREATDFCDTKRERDAKSRKIAGQPVVKKTIGTYTPKSTLQIYSDKVIEAARSAGEITRWQILQILKPLNRPYNRKDRNTVQKHDLEDKMISRLVDAGRLVRVRKAVYAAV